MIVAGFGFRTGASEDSFADALRQATTSHSPQALATIADKTRWLSQFAYAQSLPLITVAADQLVEIARGLLAIGLVTLWAINSVEPDLRSVPHVDGIAIDDSLHKMLNRTCWHRVLCRGLGR